MKNSNLKKMAVAAMFTAVSVIICMLSSVFSTMSLSISAIAGMVSAVAVENLGYKYSYLVYIATSSIVWILLPDKQCAVFYSVLFGHYPMLKLFTERFGKRFLTWFVKILEINILFLIVYFLFRFIFGVNDTLKDTLIILYAVVFNCVFVLYDVCIDRLKFFYISRIAKNGRFH